MSTINNSINALGVLFHPSPFSPCHNWSCLVRGPNHRIEHRLRTGLRVYQSALTQQRRYRSIIRLTLEVVDAVRAAIPEDMPLFLRYVLFFFDSFPNKLNKRTEFLRRIG